MATSFLERRDLPADAVQRPALRGVDGADAQPQLAADVLRVLALDGRLPEGLPARLLEVGPDALDRPEEAAPLVFLVPPGRLIGGRLLLPMKLGGRVPRPARLALIINSGCLSSRRRATPEPEQEGPRHKSQSSGPRAYMTLGDCNEERCWAGFAMITTPLVDMLGKLVAIPSISTRWGSTRGDRQCPD